MEEEEKTRHEKNISRKEITMQIYAETNRETMKRIQLIYVKTNPNCFTGTLEQKEGIEGLNANGKKYNDVTEMVERMKTYFQNVFTR